jgi:GcrA cell cycle regulator
MPAATVEWSDARIELLKKLHGEGRSAAQTAAEMGYVSRNAVLGKIHRLGLSSAVFKPPKVKKTKKEFREFPRFRPRRSQLLTKPAKVRCIEVSPRNLSLLDLEENDCRYPFGSGPFTFCGHPKIDGSSYCSNHFSLSISPGTASERRASQMVNA